MIIAINYADENFKKEQNYNTKTAYIKGCVDKVIEYSPNDIDLKFKSDYAKILSYKRGAGLWLWKPYIILKTLNEMNYGDYVFYCDSGAYYVDKVQYLVDCLESNNEEIMLYELPLLEKQFTKAEMFKFLNCEDNSFKDKNQILATYILVKKSEYTMKFFNEFLNICCDEKCISYKAFNLEVKNDVDFISHREDQSILSILSAKYKIKPFRDPSQYGNRPWEYRRKEFIYSPKEYKNSNYPQIVASYRREHLLKFKIKELIKKILYKLDLYNEDIFIKKRNL